MCVYSDITSICNKLDLDSAPVFVYLKKKLKNYLTNIVIENSKINFSLPLHRYSSSHHKNYSKMNTTVFTIEQVDLIRRLRRTGIPLDKLIYAYKEMDRLERENNSNCQQQHTQLKNNNSNNNNNPLNSFTTIAASFNNNLSHGNNGSTSGPLSISHLNTNNNSNNNSINSGQQLQLDPLSSLNSDTLNYEQNLTNVSNTGNNSSNLFGMNLQPSTSKINDTGDLHNNIMHKYALQPIMLQNSLCDEQNELMEFKKKGVFNYFNHLFLFLNFHFLFIIIHLNYTHTHTLTKFI